VVWRSAEGGHEAAIDLSAAPGIGAEVVLTVDGELRKARSACGRRLHPAPSRSPEAGRTRR
jgi:hypothetical protein